MINMSVLKGLIKNKRCIQENVEFQDEHMHFVVKLSNYNAQSGQILAALAVGKPHCKTS